MHYLKNFVILAYSFIFALIGCEVYLRIVFPHDAFGGGTELPWFREDKSRTWSTFFESDAKLGYKPKLGTKWYDSNGLIRSKSNMPPMAGRFRILFLGDSVTARGRILRAMQALLKDQSINFLNGGVESYNVSQEVEFFFRYQSRNRFDYIIHQLHWNDLYSTPIAFRDASGALNVYALNLEPQHINEWLFSNSYLYRFLLPIFVSRNTKSMIFERVRDDLKRIAAFAAKRGIQYSAVIFPLMKPYESWSPGEKSDWDKIVSACNEATSCVSLLPVLNEMSAAGKTIQEKPGDAWHPNDDFARAAAKHILESLKLSH